MWKPNDPQMEPRKARHARPTEREPEFIIPRRHVVNTKGAARVLLDRGMPISASTLKKYRARGGGPPYTRFSRGQALYPIDELNAWADRRLAKTVTSTAQEPALRRSGFLA
jgi:hypothetical protein